VEADQVVVGKDEGGIILFPWEELPREATKGRVLKFAAEIANNHNLSLVDLTVFPMLVNHRSLTVRTSACVQHVVHVP
jgi:hypothetical protein